MIGDISVVSELYIVCGYTDMRKSIDGLCAIVMDQLHMDPRRNALYLFCGKRCDRIKLLMYEKDGFVLLYKRLEADGRYRWPRNSSEVKPITWQQFDWLLTGLEIEQPKAIKTSPINRIKVSSSYDCADDTYDYDFSSRFGVKINTL